MAEACNPQGWGWKGKGLWAQTADEIDSLKLGEINDLALEMLPILTHKGSKGRLTTLTLRINAFPNCLDGLLASLCLGSGASSSGGGELDGRRR